MSSTLQQLFRISSSCLHTVSCSGQSIILILLVHTFCGRNQLLSKMVKSFCISQFITTYYADEIWIFVNGSPIVLHNSAKIILALSSLVVTKVNFETTAFFPQTQISCLKIYSSCFDYLSCGVSPALTNFCWHCRDYVFSHFSYHFLVAGF